MAKFGRNYLLTIQDQSGFPYIVRPPFTIEFDVTRNLLSSANVASVRIYNLSKINRNRILKNQMDVGNIKTIQLRAGYGTNMPLILSGMVTQSWSVRQGNDFISQINAYDGGDAFSNEKLIGPDGNFPANTPNKVMLQKLITSLAPYDVLPGSIGNYTGISARGKSFNGSTISAIKEIVGPQGFFIDNGFGNCLQDNEAIQTPSIPVISSVTGLLGTPVREVQVLNFNTIFEPTLRIGQIIYLNSIVGAGIFNQQYRINSLKHKGMISDAVCGDAVTSIGVMAGTFIPVVSL